MERRTVLATAAAALAAPFVKPGSAEAQSARAETLLLVQEYGPNSMDMQGIGSSQPVNGVALSKWNHSRASSSPTKALSISTCMGQTRPSRRTMNRPASRGVFSRSA